MNLNPHPITNHCSYLGGYTANFSHPEVEKTKADESLFLFEKPLLPALCSPILTILSELVKILIIHLSKKASLKEHLLMRVGLWQFPLHREHIF